jgi:hypothetical protein
MAAREQSLAKYDWAKKHIDDLDSFLLDFERNTDRHGILAIKHNEEAETITYYVERVPVIPPEFALRAGDILHSLRGALDYTFCGLIGDDVIKTLKGKAKFPICHTAANYRETITKVPGLSQMAVEAFDRVRPYKGGDEFLWTLHTLNNIDKHRLLLTARFINFGRSLSPKEEAELDPSRVFLSGQTRAGHRYVVTTASSRVVPLNAGDEVLTVPISEFNENMSFMLSVSINESELSEGTPLLTLLRLISNSVKNAINDLAVFL